MSQHRVKLFKIINAYEYDEYGTPELNATWIADSYSNWYDCDEDEYQKIIKAVQLKNDCDTNISKYKYLRQREQLVVDDYVNNKQTIADLLALYDESQKEEREKLKKQHEKLERLKEKVNEKKKLRELKKLKELEKKYKNDV